MGKYAGLAGQIVANVGGSRNISSVTHCATRLRLRLRDESAADDGAIEATDGVVALRKSAGQYQVVIGTQVEDVYEEVLAITGISGDGAVDATAEEAAEDSSEGNEKRGVGAVVLDYISSMMGPLLGVVCGCGVLKGIVSLLDVLGILSSTSTLYMVLYAAGDAAYYFMPILLGYTLSKKVNMSPVLGMSLGAILMYPDLQSMEEATLFGLDVSGVSYSQTMLPILAVMLVAAPLDRWLKKVLPQSISFLEPAILFLVMAPLSYAVIGPVTTLISNLITNGVQWILAINPVLAGFIVCALWQVLVLFGVHVVLASVIFTLMFMTGSSMLYPLTCVPGFAVFGISLAVYLRTKDSKNKEVALPATISAFFGVTEPSVYGILLPNIKLFVVACLVSGIAGAYMAITGVEAYQLGGSGLMCLLIAVNGSDISGVINFAIAIAFATIAGFLITFFIYRDKGGEKDGKKSDEKSAVAAQAA